jgi:hypothetical protein
MRPFFAAVAVAAAALIPSDGAAWESSTTNAGIVEQGALASRLHQVLSEQLGARGGLYSRLRVPRADAKALFTVLDKLNPVHGYVPGSKGRQLAMGWLTAGAAIADIPPEFAANHFYDPRTKRGLSAEAALRHRIASIALREDLVDGGEPAPTWMTSAENPAGLAGFHDQYRKAVTARTPAERERHIAGALVAAGAIAHIVGDMASPSHVRNDLAAHLERLSSDRTDVGSRFERVAALGYGRLGVPPAAEVPRLPTLDAYARELAVRVEAGYFSAGTLPRPIGVKPRETSASIARKLATAARRPKPLAAGPFDLDAARRPEGARLQNDAGVCLAHYRLVDRELRWTIPDACALEQIRALLPLAAAYTAGAINHLFRGSMAIEPATNGLAVKPTGIALGAGTLTAYWDDELGVRTRYATVDKISSAADKQVIAQLAPPPAAARRVAVLFEGVDGGGEMLSSAAVIAWPSKAETSPTPPASAGSTAP